MAAFNDYVSSLGKSAPSYGSLFSSTPAPSFSLFGPANYKSLFSGSTAPKTPTPAVQPAVPSSTATAPTVVNKPPTTTPSTVSSPAKQAYVSSISTPPVTPASTPPASTPTVTTPTTTDTTDPKAAYLDSYSKFLSQYTDSLAPSPEITAARTSLADIQNKQDQQSLDARKAYEDLIHTPGMLKGGAEEAGSVSNRNNSYISANLGVAESGAARTLDALTSDATAKTNALKAGMDASKPLQIGDSYIDPATGKIIYSKPQTPTDIYGSGTIGEYNYAKANGYTGSFLDYQKKVANLKNTGSDTSTSGTYVPGTNPTVDAWVSNINSGKAKLSDITGNPSLKSLVSQGLAGSQSASSNIVDTTSQSLQALSDMVTNNTGFSGAVGAKGISSLFGLKGSPIAGTAAADFDAKLKQVVNDVVLPNLTILHGLGRVTDREFQALQSSLTSLSPNLSEGEFKKELTNVIDSFNKIQNAKSSSASNTSSGTLTSPDGTQAVNVSDLTPAELKEAQTAGWK